MEPITSVAPRKRANFPLEFKAKLAARACEPGVSVSRLALEHGLNTNMLFRWRRDYRRGELSVPVASNATLLPVNLVADTESPVVELPNPSTRFGGVESTEPPPSGIEIRVAGVVIVVQGEVDPVRLRAVLAALRG